MKQIWIRVAWLIVPASLLAACTITTRVQPVPAGTLSSLCIKENDTVWSKQFLPMLREQIERHGIKTSVYRGEPPPGCHSRLEYDANWGWDMAVYLKYADVRIYQGDQLVGETTYDARHASGRIFDKFGHTDAKVAPLIDQLLSAPPSATGATGS